METLARLNIQVTLADHDERGLKDLNECLKLDGVLQPKLNSEFYSMGERTYAVDLPLGDPESPQTWFGDLAEDLIACFVCLAELNNCYDAKFELIIQSKKCDVIDLDPLIVSMLGTLGARLSIHT